MLCTMRLAVPKGQPFGAAFTSRGAAETNELAILLERHPKGGATRPLLDSTAPRMVRR